MTAPYNTILTLDFETRWDSKGYTLSKLTTEEYIRSPLFKAFGCCIHEYGTDQPTYWHTHEALPRIFASYDWSKTAILAHNSQFDAAILSFVYGVRPCFIFDSLSMARSLRGVEAGNSLMKLAEEFGLPPKGKAVHSTDGLTDISPAIEAELAAYCQHDVYLCEQVFDRLMKEFPPKELRLVDMTVRMYTEADFVLDIPMLEEALTEDNAKLEGALAKTKVEIAELASNPRFAEILTGMGVNPPTKLSKTTGKETWAFAKNDALFQALLNGDNEDVALLCEARLRVKSTLERTRSQRFIDIAHRGTLPVPLAYYGAATGRWSALKGSSINLQNMKRGSALRKSIMAPDGYVICAGDLSQIEPRVLAWLADYEDMLDIFRAGGDPYATFGAQMFGIPGISKESHPLLRQSAKSALLGCFGGDTKVLTPSGYKPIVDIRSTDLLWDGLEWVQHEGLLPQGEKAVEIAHGIAATADHKILVHNQWVEWHAVHTNPTLFKQALYSVRLPASTGAQELHPGGTSSTHLGCVAHAVTRDSLMPRAYSAEGVNAAPSAEMQTQNPQLNMAPRSRFLSKLAMFSESLRVRAGSQKTKATTRECYVAADGRGLYSAPMCSKVPQPAARNVQEGKDLKHAGSPTGITAYVLTIRTAIGYLTASAQSLFAALTQTAASIQTTVGEVSQYIQSGLQTALRSLPTLSPSTDGIRKNSRSTVSITTTDTSPETYGSLRAARMERISAGIPHALLKNSTNALPHLKQRMQTYDIAMAGPRNRFTILTDAGPIIVHNCGYQLGWISFAGQLLTGFLGAPPVMYTKADAKQLGVTADDVQKFLNWEENVKRMALIPHNCTDSELLMHCMASKAIIDKYRAAASPVVGFWDLLNTMLVECIYGGKEYTHKGVLTFRKGEVEMVNGMKLRYPAIQGEQDEKGRVQFTFQDGKKRKKIYPGLICNNVTQGTARIVMSDGLLRAQRKFPVKGTVHDEGLFLVPEATAKEDSAWIKEQMILVPKWMPGIPLNADVGFNKRYGLAKG